MNALVIKDINTVIILVVSYLAKSLCRIYEVIPISVGQRLSAPLSREYAEPHTHL